MPKQSPTADRIDCLQRSYRFVVCTEELFFTRCQTALRCHLLTHSYVLDRAEQFPQSIGLRRAHRPIQCSPNGDRNGSKMASLADQSNNAPRSSRRWRG
jgi:hypothetical protein